MHEKYAVKVMKVYSKDHVDKIDFQELIFAVVNWPNSEFYGAIVRLIGTLLWLVCYNPTG